MNLKLGSHVSMSGKSMLLGSAKEAESYGANTFMFYTGAPQNTKRKEISELNIDAAWNYMNEKNISDIVVHAPYIINLGNTVKPETYELAVEFLAKEIDRAAACKSQTLILHPGAHVGAGVETGLQQVIKGLNEVLTKDTPLHIALETMAGKGSELGRSFEELAAIYDGVVYSDKLRVCFDTCHTHDAGYDIINDFDGVIEQFDGYFSLEDTSVDEVRSRLLDPTEYWGGAYGVASNTQVIKQADIVAMLSMFKNDYTKDIMETNLKYYEPRTEHGSSLSACMYSLLACYTNNPEIAYPMFMKSAKTDLTKGGKEWLGLIYIGGTHPASAGGAWIAAVKGFAGINEEHGQLVCRPNLPEKWNGMNFKLIYKGKWYSVEIKDDKGTISMI